MKIYKWKILKIIQIQLGNFKYISDNPNLNEATLAVTIDFVKKYKDKIDWLFISSNGNMTLEIIEANSDLPWDYRDISDNSNLTINFIKKNHDQA